MPTTIPTQRVDFHSGGTRVRGMADAAAGRRAAPGRRARARFRRDARHDAAAVRAALRRRGHRHPGIRLPQHRCIRRPTPATYFDCGASAPTWTRRWTSWRCDPTSTRARVGLWGTSLGGMNVLRVAAARDDVARRGRAVPDGARACCRAPARCRAALRLAPYIVEDALRAVLRRGRRYVPIVGPPGSAAMVTVAGAEEGWNSTVPPGGHFDNRVAAADAVGLVVTSALRHARDITAPLLVCVCDRENLMDPQIR